MFKTSSFPTLSVTAIIGKGTNLSSADKVFPLWNKVAEEVSKLTGVYVGATISQAKSIYKPEFGCPEHGEDVFVVTAICNYSDAPAEMLVDAWSMAWMDSIDSIVKRLVVVLEQDSCTYLVQDGSKCTTVYIENV